MKVPLLDLNPSHGPLRDELLGAFNRVLASNQFILGSEVTSFEQEVAKAIGVPHAIAMSSGSDALLAALMALDLGPGDEVITTTYSFFATAGCVARLGATPVFVDVDPDTLNIDAASVARAVTPRTRVIMPVHLFGLPADMDELLSLATGRIVVIEDACQAIGAKYRNRPIGALGQMATFSFFPSKNLGGLGDGGLATTIDDGLAERLRMLRAHGSRKKYHHEIIGGNFRLDALQCALLRAKLPQLPSWTAQRQAAAARYRALFAEHRVTALELPPDATDRTHVFHQFVVRTPKRDDLRSWLTERGIGTEVYYPAPLHLQPCFSSLGYKPGAFPIAERACREALALPMFPGISADQQATVVREIAAFLGQQ